MVQAGRLAMAAVAIALTLLSVAAFVLVAAATASHATAGFTSCPLVRPASTGDLRIVGRSGDQTYGGFSLLSSATICDYLDAPNAKPVVWDVTVVGGNGQVTVPGLARSSVPPGVHYYVLIGKNDDGVVVAYTEKTVGEVAAPPTPVATPSATPTSSATATSLPTVTVSTSTDTGNASAAPTASGDDGTVQEVSSQGSGAAQAEAAQSRGTLAQTGAFLATVAARIGIALLVIGGVLVAVGRRRRTVGSDH